MTRRSYRLFYPALLAVIAMARPVPKPGELYCWQCGKLGRDVVQMPGGGQLCRACRSR